MKEEILGLRKLGLSIGEISKRTGHSITEICNVIYAENIKDILDDGNS